VAPHSVVPADQTEQLFNRKPLDQLLVEALNADGGDVGVPENRISIASLHKCSARVYDFTGRQSASPPTKNR